MVSNADAGEQVGPVADIMAGRQPEVLEALWRDGAVPWVKHPFGHWSMDWIRRTVAPVHRSPLAAPAHRTQAHTGPDERSMADFPAAPSPRLYCDLRLLHHIRTSQIAGWIDCTDHCLVGSRQRIPVMPAEQKLWRKPCRWHLRNK